MSRDAHEMDAYERLALDQIEAGLQVESWKPKFHRLERREWYVRRPVLFACLLWVLATVVSLAVFGVVSLVISSFLVTALVTSLLVVTPALLTAAYLTAPRN